MSTAYQQNMEQISTQLVINKKKDTSDFPLKHELT
jgi:hypothetical protein